MPILLLLLSIILSCFASTNSSPAPPKSPSFSAPLIHRNSPESPFYDPSLTNTDLNKLAARAARAQIRARNEVVGLDAFTAPVIPRAIKSAGIYYMKYKIGDPPIETYGIPDTGSRLVWLQCEPCERCYKQSIPIFNSTESSSFDKVLCTDIICTLDRGVHCLDDGFCSYNIVYGDGSTTNGYVATETITLQVDDTTGGIVHLLNMVIGCGNDNEDFRETDPDLPPGIIGLQRSNLSLVNQLGFDDFSHCVSGGDPAEGHSLIKFGSGVNITGPHTPLIPHPYGWYFVNITGIRVSDVNLNIPPSVFELTTVGTSGTIIDTGTQYFVLARDAFEDLVGEIKFQMRVFTDYQPSRHRYYDLCYPDVKFAPKITILFEGLDFEISNANAWEQVEEELFCLTIMGSKDNMSIFNVEYDLANNVVYLANTACPLIK